MKNLIIILSFVIASALLAVAFKTDGDDKKCQVKNGITVTEGEHSYPYPKAKLKLDMPDKVDTGMNKFNFSVTDFNLGDQTPDADSKQCANSAKGQHIHFILDNQPYYASYSPVIEQRVKAGDHTLLAFLSRSYHESIKREDAMIIKHFSTDKNSAKKESKEPMLFYSRPKGTYTGEKEIRKLLLDFYLVNTDLNKEGYQVKATIDGTEFMLDKWKPYYIEGLKPGKHKVKIQLVDKKGQLVGSPFNDSGDREIELLEGDPIKNMK
jgi:hypothetical protein